jgi:opacity protein-like surface antigen
MRGAQMKMKIIIVMLLFIGTAWAQEQGFTRNVSKRGSTAAGFLEIGVGARAIGMGGAYTAVGEDPSALFWNVGGIGKATRPEFFFNHTQWLANTHFDFLGIVCPISGFGTIGISLTALSMSDMDVTTVEYPEGSGQKFGAGDYAFGLAYAVNLTERFSIGFHPKVIYQYIWDMTAVGFGIDLGIHYVTPFEGITIGFAMTNFGPKISMSGENNRVLYDYDPNSTGNNDRVPALLEPDNWPLPLNFTMGIQYKLINTDMHRIIVALDAQHPNNNYESINLGLEYVLAGNYALRVGYKSLFLSDSQESLTLGAGIRYPIMGNIVVYIDYAYANFGILENVHRFSLGINL